MRRRSTLRRSVFFAGRGLFTGAPCEVAIAPASDGILFEQAGRTLRAGVENLAEDAAAVGLPAGVRARCTILSAPPAIAATVEHVLSALFGMGVTDARVTLTAPEVPILDGSSAPFARAIADADTEPLGALAPRTIDHPVVVRDDHGAEILAAPRPNGGLAFEYRLELPLPGGGSLRQTAAWEGDPGAYLRDVAPARTFCLRHEAEAMRRAGLFAHLTPRDMLVLDADGTPIDNTLRSPDEPARHKLLDLIGDLSLAGPLDGVTFIATRSGHALTHRMARALIDAARPK